MQVGTRIILLLAFAVLCEKHSDYPGNIELVRRKKTKNLFNYSCMRCLRIHMTHCRSSILPRSRPNPQLLSLVCSTSNKIRDWSPGNEARVWRP